MQPFDFIDARLKLTEKYGDISSADVLSYCMYPKVFEEYKEFTQQFGDLSVIPTRFFLAKPPIGEEIHISIDKGKMLIIKLLAVGPVSQSTGIREVFFEMNGEVRAVAVEDKSAAIEQVLREKATSDPGSVGVSRLQLSFVIGRDIDEFYILNSLHLLVLL